jgi:hypothetical protein
MDTARFLEGDIYDEFSTQQGSRSTSLYLDNLLNFGLKKRGAACQYMQFGQIACTFRISHGFQYRQDRRYIADTLNHGVVVISRKLNTLHIE